MLYDIRIQETTEDIPITDLPIVASELTSLQVTDFAKTNNLTWVKVQHQLFGGYYRNNEGTCYFIDTHC